MSSSTEVLLAAIFYKLGMLYVNETVLTKILNEVANNNKALEWFSLHPQYLTSEVLDDMFLKFVLGGLIKREFLDVNYITIMPRLAGKFGGAEFEKLNADEKEAVNEVVKLIRRHGNIDQ